MDTQYPAETHQKAYQRILCALMNGDVFLSVIESAPIYVSFEDVGEDGDLSLRIEAGRLQARVWGEWCHVSDVHVAQYGL